MYSNEIYKNIIILLGGPQNYGLILVQRLMRLRFPFSKQASLIFTLDLPTFPSSTIAL